MKVLTSNPDKTVGVCIEMDLTDKECLGVFNVQYLLEWVMMLKELYGDVPVHVYRHDSSAVKAHALAASEDGDEPYVVVTSLSEP